MTIRRAAFAATTGLAAVSLAAVSLLAGAPAGAQEGLLPIEVTPTSGAAGDVVTVSGEGCVGETGPGDIEIYLFFEDEEPIAAFGADEVTDEGAWTLELLIEATDPPGLYAYTATCFEGPESDLIIADYEFADFEITAAAPTTTTTTAVAPPAVAPPAVAPQAQPAVAVQAQPTFSG